MTTEPKAEGGEAVAYIEESDHPPMRGLVWADHPANTPGRRFTPLYLHPTTPAVEALARADVEFDAAYTLYHTDEGYTKENNERLHDARKARAAALAHPEIAALLKETK